MVKRNRDIAKLQSNYLFVEIARRKEEFLHAHPGTRLISLGVGDTTLPISDVVREAFIKEAKKLRDPNTYTGYEPAFGREELRARIADRFYRGKISTDEIFVSDGSKCDIARLQLLFGSNCTIAVQDPSYPAYVGSTVITGKSGEAEGKGGQYKGIRYLPCTPDNDFCPGTRDLDGVDILYLCSPNNPTGQALTKAQLEEFVRFAKQNKLIIIYDSAYAGYIRDPELPKTIYVVEGAEEVAIETSSFSKSHGFTGVRLGWTVVPKELAFEDGTPVRSDWMKIMTTLFNGASNFAQAGGIAALSDEGIKSGQQMVDAYLKNADILRDAVESIGLRCYGGLHAPYLWVDLKGGSSWEMFDRLLHEAHLVTTPGVGFGPSGEGFLRISALGKKADMEEAALIIKSTHLK